MPGLDTERGQGYYRVQTRRKALHGYWEVGDVIAGSDYPQSNLVALVAMGEIVPVDGPPRSKSLSTQGEMTGEVPATAVSKSAMDHHRVAEPSAHARKWRETRARHAAEGQGQDAAARDETAPVSSD